MAIRLDKCMICAISIAFSSSVVFAQTPRSPKLPAAVSSTPVTAPAATPIPSMLQLGGSMVLKVHSYSQTREALLDASRREGAQVLDARTFVNPKGLKHGYIRLRVAAPKLAAFRADVLPLGTLYSESVQSSDAASDYDALALRIQQLKEHEARLEGILNSRRNMRGNDILFLQERLYKANTDEVELIQQRSDLLRGTEAGTFSVAMFEPGSIPEAAARPLSPAAWFAGSLKIARDGFGRQLDRGATAAAYAATWAPVWVPAAIVALLILWWLWRRRTRIAAWLKTATVATVGALGRGIVWARDVQLTTPRKREKPPA